MTEDQIKVWLDFGYQMAEQETLIEVMHKISLLKEHTSHFRQEENRLVVHTHSMPECEGYDPLYDAGLVETLHYSYGGIATIALNEEGMKYWRCLHGT